MNNERRKAIAKARDIIEAAKGQLEEARDIIEAAADEERAAFDNMPEGLQQSERGQKCEAAADSLDEAKDAFEDFDIDNILSHLETAVE